MGTPGRPSSASQQRPVWRFLDAPVFPECACRRSGRRALPGRAAAALAATAPQQAHGHGTATPIQHVVVIFQENVSFDHYFGTYPHAANTDGNPFHAQPGNAECERPGPGAAGAQPELGQPPAADPGAGADL